jgi:hypothetical protein
VNALIRSAFRLEMQVSRPEQNGSCRAKTSQQSKRDLPVTRGGQRKNASRANPKRNTIPMWIPVCEGH